MVWPKQSSHSLIRVYLEAKHRKAYKVAAADATISNLVFIGRRAALEVGLVKEHDLHTRIRFIQWGSASFLAQKFCIYVPEISLLRWWEYMHKSRCRHAGYRHHPFMGNTANSKATVRQGCRLSSRIANCTLISSSAAARLPSAKTQAASRNSIVLCLIDMTRFSIAHLSLWRC